MEPGEYRACAAASSISSRRAAATPVRLDFFGDTLETHQGLRRRDAAHDEAGAEAHADAGQRGRVRRGGGRSCFRTRYVELFGGDDRRRSALRGGQRRPALPRPGALAAAVPRAPGDAVRLSAGRAPSASITSPTRRSTSRFEQIAEHYEARVDALEQQSLRRAALQAGAARAHVSRRQGVGGRARRRTTVRELTPFEEAEAVRTCGPGDGRARPHASPPNAQQGDANVFDAVVAHMRSALHAEHRRVIVAAWTPGARERLVTLLADHGLDDLAQGRELRRGAGAAGRCDRARRARRSSRASRRRSSPSSASRTSSATGSCARAASRAGRRRSDRGDEPVGRRSRRARRPRHRPLRRPADHHRARRAARLPRDRTTRAATSCSCPSRTSSCCRATARTTADAQLDRLGGVAWQSRKARLKKRLREIAVRADQDRGAARSCGRRPRLRRRQARTTSSSRASPTRRPRTRRPASMRCWTISAPGSPMDRLVCGDVGFGKTEVALRAAFVAAHERLAGGGRGADDAARAPALHDLLRALQGPADPRSRRPRASSAPRSWPSVKAGLKERRRSTSSSARTRCSASRSSSTRLGLLDHRRGAALRRHPQGAPEEAARGRARADAVGDADPAHAAAGACRACASCRSSPRRPSIAWRCAPTSRRSIPSSCAKRCGANATAAGRPSTSCRASPTSTTSPSSCARRCRS